MSQGSRLCIIILLHGLYINYVISGGSRRGFQIKDQVKFMKTAPTFVVDHAHFQSKIYSLRHSHLSEGCQNGQQSLKYIALRSELQLAIVLLLAGLEEGVPQLTQLP